MSSIDHDTQLALNNVVMTMKKLAEATDKNNRAIFLAVGELEKRVDNIEKKVKL